MKSLSILTLLVLVTGSVFSQVKISALPATTDASAGILPMSRSGVTYKVPSDSIAALSAKEIHSSDGSLTFENSGPKSINAKVSGGIFGNNFLFSIGGLVLEDSTVTVLPDIIALINGKPDTTDTPQEFIIPAAAPGYYRTDLIYITSAGDFDTLQGIPDTDLGVPPSIPTGGIAITYVNVFGSVITTPVQVSAYQRTAVVTIGADGKLKTDSTDLRWVGGSFDLGASAALGTSNRLTVNGSRSMIVGDFNGFIYNVGSWGGVRGSGNPVLVDASKYHEWTNRGNPLMRLTTTTPTDHALQLFPNVGLKLAGFVNNAGEDSVLVIDFTTKKVKMKLASSIVSPGWSLTGNTGTNSSTNYIGTNDAQHFIIKVNGNRAAKFNYQTLGASFGQNSEATGINSFAGCGNSSATGLASVALGNGAVASGPYSFSAAQAGISDEYASASFNSDNYARGQYSFSAGRFNSSRSQYCATFGRSNDSTDTRNDTIRLFAIGNGSISGVKRSNILTATITGIGIGNVNSPSAALDVSGDTRFRNNGTPGTGKVATGTDGNGNWTWQTVTPTSTDVFGEENTGSTSSTITIAHSATAGTVRLFKNGIRLPASEYSVSGTTVTLTSARLAGDLFIIDYKY